MIPSEDEVHILPVSAVILQLVQVRIFANNGLFHVLCSITH